ncbi:ABC transporter permease [Inconstantimicrobium mannanitabidum]|uniref:Peptide ABC transporter permease n=1 Tax=Inconstantimicrobium mannanitabidum TaxID=1604901 RepID=A0ACB5RDB3_9CLOT|nr:ABC transporter permease [Clostridium sp. TW13]GKX67085.1 peptide ABC transporter permease [Clostridium sp. TW13]
MLRYLIKRACAMIVTLFIIMTATFFLLAAVPGDPLTEKVSKLPPNIRAEMYKKYGYDKPVFERYLKSMQGIITRFDFGQSIVYPGQTIQSVMKEKAPISARLGIQQIILGIGIGLILGVIAAVKRGTWVDYGIVTIAMIFVSVPSLVIALILQITLAGNYFPIIGWPTKGMSFISGFKYTVLPTLAGAFAYIAGYARLMKTSMLDNISQDYVLTAKSKGLSRVQVISRHVFRNSFLPIVTNLPLTIAFVITGSFFIERVYSIPGAGQYFVDAVTGRDVPMIMGQTLLTTILYLIVLFLTDILYTVVDPRIRISGGKR